MSSSVKYDKVQIVTVHQLKQIFDNFIQLPSFSSNDLIEILDPLNRIDDKQLLTNVQLIDHKVYTIFIFMLKDLLHKWYTNNSFTQFESSYLFPSLTKLFCKMNYYSIDLVDPLKNCLNNVAKHDRYLDDVNNMELLSSLVKLYIQDEQIMNAIVNYLCSDQYLNMFHRTENVEKFLLLIYPRYFQDYQGPRKKEMAEKLLNTLIKSIPQLLKYYSKSMENPVCELLNLLNHNFQLCMTATLFDTDQLLPFIDALLSILDEKPLSQQENSPIIKYSIGLLQILIDKNEAILKYVQQREDIFQRLKESNRDLNEKLSSNTRTSFWHERNQKNDIQVPVASTITTEVIVDIRQVPNTFSSSNENQSKEEVTLIWCDQNIDVHNDKKKTVDLLQQVNDYVLICSNTDSCLEYINQIQTEKVFLILSGQTTDDMIDKVHDLKQVDSIYIFCINSYRYEHYLKEHHKKYYKIIGIYTKHESLLRSIQENIRYFIKQSQVTSLFEQFERSIRGLTSESHSFDIFYAFKYVLFRTNYDEEHARKEMIEVCRNYYRGNHREMANINEFEQTYNSSNALQWYTRSTFVFRLVNKALRTEDYDVLLAFRFYIIDLSKALRLKYDDLKQQQGLSTIVTYRGVKLAPHEIYNLKHNLGKTIATNGFLSTSRSKDVAEMFAGKGTKYLGLETVMLEIHVNTRDSTIVMADIAHYSEFPEEEEVLFELGASFIIDSVTYDDIDDTWWVKLSAVSEEILTNNAQILIKTCRETEMNLLMGELLMKMGLYSTGRKYLETLFDLYENVHENVAIIDSLIAWIYEEEKNYDQAISYYTKAFDRYTSSNQHEKALNMINCIAICYHGKKDDIIARQYAEKAYDLAKSKAHLPDNHCLFGNIMNTFGTFQDDNNQTRLNYHMKALDIYQNVSTTCKCNDHDTFIAQTFEYIGIRYRDEEKYEQAIEYFQKSENLRSKYITLWRDRKAYGLCLIMLSSIYEITNNEMMKMMYFNKFIEIADNDLNELVLKDELDFQRFMLQIKAKDNIFENLLVYEVKILKLLENTRPLNYEKIIDQHVNMGRVYAKTKDYKWAREHYDKAYELCQTNITAIEKQAQYFFDIGHRLLLDDRDYALKFIGKALEIRMLILKNDDVNIAFSYNDMARLYESKNMFDNAIEHYQKAIDILEKHINDEQNYQFNVKNLYAKCHYYTAGMYRHKKEFDRVIVYLYRAANFTERYISDIENNYCFLADCYRWIAINYCAISNHDASAIFYEKYLETMEKHPEILPEDKSHEQHSTEIASALSALGTFYGSKGNYDQAFFYLQKFINFAPTDHDDIPLCCTLMGIHHMKKNHYEKAIENYQKAINHVENEFTNNQNYYVECLTSMALCYLKLGKSHFDKAIDCTLKAINMCEPDFPGNKNMRARCYLLYSEILWRIGRYDQSINIANQLLVLYIENKQIIGLVYGLLGWHFFEKDHFQRAFTYTKLGIENYNEYCPAFNDEYSISIYCIMAMCLVRLNNFNEALSYALKSQKISDNFIATLNVTKANIHTILALIYSKQHQYEKSREHCQIALDMCQQLIQNGDDISDIGEIFEYIGELFRDQRQFNESIKFYKKALKYFKYDHVDDHLKIQRIQAIVDKLSEDEFES